MLLVLVVLLLLLLLPPSDLLFFEATEGEHSLLVLVFSTDSNFFKCKLWLVGIIERRKCAYRYYYRHRCCRRSLGTVRQTICGTAFC